MLLFIGGFATARMVTVAYDEKPMRIIVVHTSKRFHIFLPAR